MGSPVRPKNQISNCGGLLNWNQTRAVPVDDLEEAIIAFHRQSQLFNGKEKLV
jgi:hypothetical protein